MVATHITPCFLAGGAVHCSSTVVDRAADAAFSLCYQIKPTAV
ncbi:MAG: hypothetical protein Q9M13_04460 [Mariprofundales bacterium]|nr:hypothetical protein [Mariprofundales bacterium]